ncbi:hypothetical protein ACLBXM_02505 [Xanthobacteraceae bacterium A53D]
MSDPETDRAGRVMAAYRLNMVGIFLFPCAIVAGLKLRPDLFGHERWGRAHARWQVRTAIFYWVAVVMLGLIAYQMVGAMPHATPEDMEAQGSAARRFSFVFCLLFIWALVRFMRGWYAASVGLMIDDPDTLWIRPKIIPRPAPINHDADD